MPDPTIEAAREIFDESVDHLREAIEGLSPDALAWRPAGEDSNPITVLAVHGMHSSRWWLSIARGLPLAGARPSVRVRRGVRERHGPAVVRGRDGRRVSRPARHRRGVRPRRDPPDPGSGAGDGGLGPPARARALPRARRAGAADPPAVCNSGRKGAPAGSPAVAVDLLVERTSAALHPRSRRLFVLGAIARAR